MSIFSHDKYVYRILNQTDSYPFVPDVQIDGVGMTNDGEDTVTVVINDGETEHTINLVERKAYSANFKAVKSINVTSGTTYQIELRRV